MTGWGKDETKHDQLQGQVRRVKQRGPTQLEKDHAYYSERAADTTVPAKERKLWEQLRDEVGHRLGKDAPPSKQEEVPFDNDDRST
jgi:hypothetical protein